MNSNQLLPINIDIPFIYRIGDTFIINQNNEKFINMKFQISKEDQNKIKIA